MPLEVVEQANRDIEAILDRFGATAMDMDRLRSSYENVGMGVDLERATLADFERWGRSEEHTSELQSLMRISYAVFCLKKKKKKPRTQTIPNRSTDSTSVD